MFRALLVVLSIVLLIPQANAVAIFGDDGSSVENWTAHSGQWESVDGAIVMNGEQGNGVTFALLSNTAIDYASLTFPITLTYDLKVELDAPSEIWTAVGLFAPSLSAGNIEDGAVVVALRTGNGGEGLHILVGGRQWISQDLNFDWLPDTWYTMRVVLSNPDFTANKVDIDATIHQKGAEGEGIGVGVSLAGAPAGGNAFELGQTGLALYSRNGNGGVRSFDNIVLEAANVPNGKVVYDNDGTDVSGFTAVQGTFEVVDGAIVRTDPVKADTTQAFILQNVIDYTNASMISLEYDIKVESITTQSSETWSGIGLFTPPATAGNIEDGAVVMAFRDGGVGNTQGRGLHALLGGRAWLERNPNLFWKPDTWYHMSVTVMNPDIANGKTDILATLSEIGGTGAASVILRNAPSTNRYELTQTGISLFSRSGGNAEGGKRSWDNIRVVEVGATPTSNNGQFDLFR